MATCTLIPFALAIFQVCQPAMKTIKAYTAACYGCVRLGDERLREKMLDRHLRSTTRLSMDCHKASCADYQIAQETVATTGAAEGCVT